MKQYAMSHKPILSHDGPIGVFDSGYGGLTILQQMQKRLPQYDYIYLGDNARAPYGTRSFDIVCQFTLQAVEHLFSLGCPLVILACNTASAKALRSIQQNNLPNIDPSRRVLGVIRPTAEAIGTISQNGHIGLLATPGTVRSHSYEMEIEKLYPDYKTAALECPMLVPLVENREHTSQGADYFVEKYVNQLLCADPLIDTVILGCTHYPLLEHKIKEAINRLAPNRHINVVCQGILAAESLADYLHRHPEMDQRLLKNASTQYLTTENPETFSTLASMFMDAKVAARHTIIN
ncbi:glutamate racemase [uncultured Muribaculum sp.]|uniref:glutamate racemase n=1 Tax=uncultured Muribaculum sp. TaxID=1918613 RepID=UPI00272CC8B7|nr:glutamate racemase [uncultured Muribaculum sp.]